MDHSTTAILRASITVVLTQIYSIITERNYFNTIHLSQCGQNCLLQRHVENRIILNVLTSNAAHYQLKTSQVFLEHLSQLTQNFQAAKKGDKNIVVGPHSLFVQLRQRRQYLTANYPMWLAPSAELYAATLLVALCNEKSKLPSKLQTKLISSEVTGNHLVRQICKARFVCELTLFFSE